MRNKITLAIILLLQTVVTCAQQEYFIQARNTFVYGGMWFRQTGDATAEVRENAFEGLTAPDTVVIPASVQDSAGNIFTVTRICEYAFYYNNARKEYFVLPETLLEIGGHAFQNNRILHSIELPSKLRGIGEDAFSGCGLGGRITLPDSLDYIAPTAFFSNDTITEYHIANSQRFCTVNGILYNSDTTEIIIAPYMGQDTFLIPQHVRRIGSYSLCDCGANSIVLNEGLREIGLYAFPSRMTQLFIPASVSHIDGRPTNGAPTRTTITVDSASRHYKAEDQMLTSYDGDTVFAAFGTWFGTKTLTEGIKVLATGAFSSITTLDKIDLPYSLEEIGDYAFYNTYCNIDSWGSVRKIGTRALYFNTGVTKLMLPHQLTDIADYAFEHSAIDTIVFGDSLRVIPRGVLSECRLKKITLGNHVEHIMPEAFAYSYGSVTLKIGNDHYLPATLRTIGRDAFRGCDIQRVKFHHNPDTVGEYAFDQTLRVFFEDTVPPVVYTGSFMAGCDVYVPCHGTDIFTAAPGWGPSFDYHESPCPPTAVGEAYDEAAFCATAVGGRITVTRHQPVELAIYDIMGRRLLTSPAAAGTTVFDAPATGVYILRAGEASAKMAIRR